jgi:hypothetical protein
LFIDIDKLLSLLYGSQYTTVFSVWEGENTEDAIDQDRRAQVGIHGERSKKMINQEMVHQDLRSVEGKFASPAHGGRFFSLLLDAQEEAGATLARAQEEDAAIEAQDALSQADEALVMG